MMKYFVIFCVVFSMFTGTSQQLDKNDDESSSSDTLGGISSEDLMKALEFLGNVFEGTAHTEDLNDYQKQLLSHVIQKINDNPEVVAKLLTVTEKLTNLANNLPNTQDAINEDQLQNYDTVLTEDT